MNRQELEKIRKTWVESNVSYNMRFWKRFNYKILQNIMYSKRPGKGYNYSYSDAIIMADTETSKKSKVDGQENHVVAWTISIRAFNKNLVTLWGRDPEEFTSCIAKIRKYIEGDKIIIYFHNLPYDWVFLELFMFEKFGHPEQQLNIKSHYPLFINFENGIQFRDSLILAQRSLEKWADDLHVEHKKSVGLWDYEKIRNQKEDYTADELEYIEHDTLAGVECIQKTMDALNKKIFSLPYTATGIPREEVRKRGKANNAKDLFDRIAPTYEQYIKLTQVFHGGFTHANRHLIDELITSLVSCYDFASSYPYVLLSCKYPMEKFTAFKDCKIQDVLSSSDQFAFMFKLILIRPHLKTDFTPMPVLQFSKCVKTINAITDNGRILCADYVEIYTNEIDLNVINSQYDFDGNACIEVEKSYKDYLPRWYTDYIFELFKQKCTLKGGDPVLYALAKARLNSVYGLSVQHSIKETITEDYQTGEFTIDTFDSEEEYEKYLKNRGNILNYAWGVWCTSYAMHNLFELGKCIKKEGTISHWIYSDTDSIYSDAWDEEKVKAYNDKAKELLKQNGYGPVIVNNKEYWLGIAEHKKGEDDYVEFKVQGAKRYCGRNAADNKLHITVAGVPKKGAVCLNDDINNFTKGMIFSGSKTGKKEHKYFYVDKIYSDPEGNLTGHSIDLSPCDYLLDNVASSDNWMDLFNEDVETYVFDEGRI